MSARGRKGRKVPTPRREWQPLHEATVSDEAAALLDAEGWPRGTYDVWLNDRYQVLRRAFSTQAFAGGGTLVHLSIKRRDRKAVHDWRHLQRIKNELVSAECEAVELYPAESRLLDEANQYHLWVVADESFRFPFGSPDRLVGDETDVGDSGARQRPMEPGLAWEGGAS